MWEVFVWSGQSQFNCCLRPELASVCSNSRYAKEGEKEYITHLLGETLDFSVRRCPVRKPEGRYLGHNKTNLQKRVGKRGFQHGLQLLCMTGITEMEKIKGQSG